MFMRVKGLVSTKKLKRRRKRRKHRRGPTKMIGDEDDKSEDKIDENPIQKPDD
jgi:hypothetical protein